MSGRAGLEPTTEESSDCGRRPLFLALLFVGVLGALAACSLVGVLDGLAAFMGGTLHRREPERGRAAGQRGDGDRQYIWCQQFADKGWSNRAVERQGTGEFIGFTGLSVPRRRLPFSPCGKTGWCLKRSAGRRGCATEGAKACLRVGVTQLGLEEIVSFTTLKNRPSVAASKAICVSFGRPVPPGGARPHDLAGHSGPSR